MKLGGDARLAHGHNGGVERFEFALEVGPIEPEVVARLNEAGFSVYKGNRSWRVIAQGHPDGRQTIFDQAMAMASDILLDFRLKPLHAPPTVALRDPDAMVDTAMAELVLEDARRSYDPDPLPRQRRRWWEKQMELGLGERKGD